MFQFQSGTVKRRRGFQSIEGIFLFQFQSGTVKRNKAKCVPIVVIVFQFQSGTVKSINDLEKRVCNARFNSNLVRLKDLAIK